MVDADQAFLRSLDKPVILWLMSRKLIHGYGIIKELKKITGRQLTPGFVYPFLNELEEKGYTISEWIERNNRIAKYYSLTEKGEALLNKIRELFDKPIGDVLAHLLS